MSFSVFYVSLYPLFLSLAYERADIHLVHHERVRVTMDCVLTFDWNERRGTYERHFMKSIQPTVVVEEVTQVPVIMKMYSMRMTLSIQAIEFMTAFVLYMLYLFFQFLFRRMILLCTLSCCCLYLHYCVCMNNQNINDLITNFVEFLENTVIVLHGNGFITKCIIFLCLSVPCFNLTLAKTTTECIFMFLK